MWRYGFAIFLALNAANARGAEASEDFGAKRYPLAPTLTENHVPELCNPVLGSVLDAFRSAEPAPTLSKGDLDYVTWIEWQEPEQREELQGRVFRAEADLDDTGAAQAILYGVYPHSWRGDWHYAYVGGDSAALDRSVQEAGGLSKLLPPPDNQYEPTVGSPALLQFYPVAKGADGSRIIIGDVWSEPEIFHWRGRTYLLNQSSDQDGHASVPLAVYRVQADASLILQCLVDIPDRYARIDAAVASSGLRGLTQHLRRIGGSGQEACGTLNAGARHVSAAMSASRNVASRPWAVSRHDAAVDPDGAYFVYDERLREFLQDWSRASAWNRIVYLELQQHIDHAIGTYAGTLKTEFGLAPEIVAERARTVVERLVAAWIQVPRTYVPGAGWHSFPPSRIASAILARDPVALADALKNSNEELPAGADVFPQRDPPVSAISSRMHDAVIWPASLDALLTAGADVDARNVFGKTPLMTAAHMNRPDAVRKLLEQKADVNARTDAPFTGCGYSIHRGERTALMYAAENAGIETIRLLLDAGADPTAKDSQGDGAERYLALNPRFAELQGRMSITELARQQAPVDAASFACDGRLNHIEAAICGDEILRLYDREIADAYARLLQPTGTAMRTEQRRWLKDRAAACPQSAQEAKTGCLQDFVGARLRYLHARLADSLQ